MLWFLRALFLVVLGSMLAVTGWASWQVPLFAIPVEVFGHPWFIAALFDAYWGFITFFVWAAWKEQSLGARVLWFVAVIGLGNLAMSVYLLRELFAVRTSDELGLVITRRNPGHRLLPGALAALSVGVYVIALL